MNKAILDFIRSSYASYNGDRCLIIVIHKVNNSNKNSYAFYLFDSSAYEEDIDEDISDVIRVEHNHTYMEACCMMTNSINIVCNEDEFVDILYRYYGI